MSNVGPLAVEADSVYSHHAPQWTVNLTLAVLTILGGFFVRIHHLAVKDIWWDEAHSWWYATKPLAQGITEGMAAWHGAAGDPLFTVLLHFWIRLAGDGAFAMRFLSVIATTITAAYQLLEADGLIERFVGRGSFVTHTDSSGTGDLRWQDLLAPSGPSLPPLPQFQTSGDLISFSTSSPSEELFPLAIVRAIVFSSTGNARRLPRRGSLRHLLWRPCYRGRLE